MPSPLLPVHSMRHPQKKSRRKATCMRLVIFAAILFCVGYALYATRYIGSSKYRKTAQDTVIRTQLETSRLAHLEAAAAGGNVRNDGRTLTADDEAPSPHRNRHFKTTHGHAERPQPRRRLEVSPESFSDADADLYDEVVATDTSDRGGENVYHGSVRAEPQVAPVTTAGKDTHVTGRGDQTLTSPLTASHDRGTQQAQPQLAQQQQPPQAVHPQDFHLSSTGGPGADGAHTVAGPGEVDREAEAKRASLVTAPSLAVGSRIEADSRTASNPVVEPGASPGAPKEPASVQPVHVPTPITVTHLEPDSHQAQQHVDLQAPVLTQAPRETDSSSGSGGQHRAPDDAALQTPGSQTGAVTGAPVVAPVVAPVTAPVVAPVVPSGGSTTIPSVPVPAVQDPAPVHVPSPRDDVAPQKNPLAKGFYALEAVDIDGKMRSLSEFAGKVTVVVNVASACGYTDENYKGLMKMYEKYKPHGLEVLGFPCNQFGSQESGTETEIKSFCSAHYHVNFPMFSKVDVNGPHVHPVYQYLKRELPATEGGGGGVGPGQDLVWNFQKIFVNHEGKPVKRIYQAWDQVAVEHEVYRLLHEARRDAMGGTATS